MKNFIIVLLVILTAGCALQKKSVSLQTSETKTVQTTVSISDQSEIKVDTTKISDHETIYTKTEYYKPSETGSSETPTVNNSGEIKGPVKSVETWTTKKKIQNTGLTEEHKAVQRDSIKNESNNVVQKSIEKEQPAPDPKRWRYIFYILMILVAGFIYLKRAKVLPWLSNVFSVIRKFLKI